jgi:hypothetical protein
MTKEDDKFKDTWNEMRNTLRNSPVVYKHICKDGVVAVGTRANCLACRLGDTTLIRA